MKAKLLLAAAAVALLGTMAANAQQRVHPPITNKEWETPFPGFKIVGNFYYVGTYDLGCYLISTNQGLILINSGAPGSFPLIKANGVVEVIYYVLAGLGWVLPAMPLIKWMSRPDA